MAEFKPIRPSNLSLDEIESVCRICLFPNPILYSVFKRDIDILLSAFTQHKVYQNDGYPHQICGKCYDDAKQAYNFKKQCEYAHNFIKSIIQLPSSKKAVYCNVCVKQLCSNSNLKRHLKNVHGLHWEIGSFRPDQPIGLVKIDNFERICEYCGEKFKKNQFYHQHICPSSKENVSTINDIYDTELKEPDDPNLTSFSYSEISCQLDRKTDFFRDKLNENKIDYSNLLTKKQTFKDLVILESGLDPDKIKILKYFDLMPKNKQFQYDNLVQRRKEERKLAYNILKKLSENRKRKQSSYCCKCNIYFNDLSLLQQHRLHHSNERKHFSCSMCLKKFSHPDFLTWHNKNIHPETKETRPFQCTLCYRLFTQVTDLTSHEKQCSVEQQLLTNQALFYETTTNLPSECSYSTTERDNLKNYDFELQNESNEEFGGSNIKKEANLNDQDETNYLDLIGYNDESCNLSNPKDEILQLLSGPGVYSKEMFKKMEQKTRNENGRFECELCLKQFNRKSHVQRHYLTHTNSKPFACRFCNTKFACPDYVQTHEKRVHRDKRNMYNNTISDISLKNSIESNSNKNNDSHSVKSDLTIKYEYNSNNFLKYEVLKTIDGKFKCNFCEKTFSRKDHVRRHEKVHSKIQLKTFKCNHCSSSFSRSDNLRKHSALCLKTF